jgi:release factor glutamine methyltransferase
MEIYQPSDDSYLLQKTIGSYLKNKSKNLKIIDIGSGSGIQALTCKKLGFKSILAIDINPDAVKHLKKQKLKAIQSNLFSSSKLKNKKFDLIIFNPPYLPEDKREPKDSRQNTTAGKKGYEIIIKFLKQAKKHLKNKDSSLLLLFSSLSKPKVILKTAKDLKYNFQLLDQQKLFFEELFVFEFKLSTR